MFTHAIMWLWDVLLKVANAEEEEEEEGWVLLQMANMSNYHNCTASEKKPPQLQPESWIRRAGCVKLAANNCCATNIFNYLHARRHRSPSSLLWICSKRLWTLTCSFSADNSVAQIKLNHRKKIKILKKMPKQRFINQKSAISCSSNVFIVTRKPCEKYSVRRKSSKKGNINQFQLHSVQAMSRIITPLIPQSLSSIYRHAFQWV